MSKAEERALKAYPVKIAGRDGYDENLRERKGFVKGYHQAEKDLELTVEDIEIILNAFLDFCIEEKEQEKTKRYTDKEYCHEVLKCFKERKEK